MTVSPGFLLSIDVLPLPGATSRLPGHFLRLSAVLT